MLRCGRWIQGCDSGRHTYLATTAGVVWRRSLHDSSSSYRNLLSVLSERGFISQLTHDAQYIHKHLSTPRTLYAGFDPTASSLHVGNLLVLMVLLHAQRAGHRCICLLGGATGMIGDPSGRKTDRKILDPQQLVDNTQCIHKSIHQILNRHRDTSLSSQDSSSSVSPVQPVLVLNNLSWFTDFSVLSFLREVGVHYRVASLLSKASVSSRIRTTGISFTEFSYQLLQGYDWWWLHQHHQCTVQIGGNDQWGNITAGLQLIQSKRKGTTQRPQQTQTLQQEMPEEETIQEDMGVYGLTLPLLLTAGGEKFGKSAGNAVWLAPDLTSPYAFYQHWLHTPDTEVDKYMKLFTLLPLQDIERIQQTMEPRQRVVRLAEEVTRLVHGVEGLESAQAATRALFHSSPSAVSASSAVGATDLGGFSLSRAALLGLDLASLLVLRGCVSSRSEARRLVAGGGVYLNTVRVLDHKQTISHKDVDDSGILRLRVGKQQQYVVQVT